MFASALHLDELQLSHLVRSVASRSFTVRSNQLGPGAGTAQLRFRRTRAQPLATTLQWLVALAGLIIFHIVYVTRNGLKV
ncbi:hypothetical protein [Nocardia sp. NPDC004711]